MAGTRVRRWRRSLVPRASPLTSRLAVDGKLVALGNDLVAHLRSHGLVSCRIEHVANPPCQLDHVRLAIAARGDRGRADTQAGGYEGLLRVVWHRVLVHRDVRRAQ